MSDSQPSIPVFNTSVHSSVKVQVKCIVKSKEKFLLASVPTKKKPSVFNTPDTSIPEITKITFEDSSVTYSCGKIQSAMMEVNENNSKNRRGSLRCHKAKKNETIHAHMSRIQKEERLKRIRRWQQPNIGDSPAHGTLHSSLQLVSGDHYNSSLNISNEQRKEHEAILVDGSFQSSHYNFLPVINPNQIPFAFL
ncbi:hypothetical protein TNIN_378031 [Trichonephila inaurata madagascariensis]|uniref:Uncharacterized protein n=1 Tax=Trichonephila inaurata madagascariensis TaxID=2747483 RepID=A0A8X7BUK6_9ARAC|nr:hypothetical protein TNIN_378031 [Trichonephila inaurata madagascariensis]